MNISRSAYYRNFVVDDPTIPGSSANSPFLIFTNPSGTNGGLVTSFKLNTNGELVTFKPANESLSNPHIRYSLKGLIIHPLKSQNFFGITYDVLPGNNINYRFFNMDRDLNILDTSIDYSTSFDSGENVQFRIPYLYDPGSEYNNLLYVSRTAIGFISKLTLEPIGQFLSSSCSTSRVIIPVTDTSFIAISYRGTTPSVRFNVNINNATISSVWSSNSITGIGGLCDVSTNYLLTVNRDSTLNVAYGRLYNLSTGILLSNLTNIRTEYGIIRRFSNGDILFVGKSNGYYNTLIRRTWSNAYSNSTTNVWSKYLGDDVRGVKYIEIDEDDNIYLYLRPIVDFNTDPSFKLLRKYDSNGELVWEKNNIEEGLAISSSGSTTMNLSKF